MQRAVGEEDFSWLLLHVDKFYTNHDCIGRRWGSLHAQTEVPGQLLPGVEGKKK